MKDGIVYGAVIGTILALDQVTKALALIYFKTAPVTVLPFFNLVLVWNKGVSFGLFNDGMMGPLILAGLSLAITAVLFVWLLRVKHRLLGIALCFVIAGAIGNVIDRLRFGAVVDFLDFHAFGYHWPAFNIADSTIVLGIAFLVIDGLFFEANRQKSDTNDEKQPAS